MTDERWPRVKALFQSAMERPLAEREAFLAAATGEDDALRREVESLLTSDTSDVHFLDRLPVASASVLAGALVVPLIRLFEAPPVGIDWSLMQFAPNSDGSRFLFNARVEDRTPVGLTVVANWPALLAPRQSPR